MSNTLLINMKDRRVWSLIEMIDGVSFFTYTPVADTDTTTVQLQPFTQQKYDQACTA